jgi:eukaryotic-like serine/threonine-protein kinase
MQPEDLVGQTLGHYRIKRQIGYGGMATVFLAEDIHLGREVALKVFWPRSGETQDFLRRFSREARVLAQLDHPHILPIYDYGEQGERAYLVTPYMSGGTLRNTLQNHKVLPPSEAIELITQVLPALQYAHDRNLVHRDIKPGNLLFKSDGSLVLADFGLVKVVEGDGKNNLPLETLSQTTQSFVGTPEYMAPEQIEGKAAAASDIYSLGIVFYEMLTGTRPFTGTSLLHILMKHVHEPPRPPRELNPYISPQLEAVILRALEKDPRKRFTNPIDFQKALLQISNRVNNPVSNPGLAIQNNPMSVTNRDNSTIPAEWGQAPASMPPHGSALQSLPTTNQPVSFGNTQPPLAPVILQAQQGVNNAVNPIQPIQPWAPPPNSAPSFTPPQKRSRTPIVVLVILLLLLLGLVGTLFFTPVGAGLLGKNQSTPTPGGAQTTPGRQTVVAQTPQGGAGKSTPAVSTKPVPSTQTSCPASGTARAAVTAPLALGNHPTIVYIVNEGPPDAPTAGTVKIYDTVTQNKIELAKNNQTLVNEAQISNDGQWVLFAATIAGQSELRMVRLDGQGQQTLLCAPVGTTIRYSQWSIDQKYVIFDEFPQVGEPVVYLLTMQTGALTIEVTPPASGMALFPRTWLDFNRVLMVGIVPNSDAPPQNIYVLDTRNGANQSMSSIPLAFDSSASPTCWDFDSTFDGSALYIAQCTSGSPDGSSRIIKQLVDGNSPSVTLNSSTLALDTVRVIDPNDTHLLALSADVGRGGPSGDPAYDGLYLIKTSDQSLQRLTSTPAGEYSNLNSFSQYFWSNVSRDGSMYVLQTTRPGANEYQLSYGKLSGGSPTVFADITGTVLEAAGWTTT